MKTARTTPTSRLATLVTQHQSDLAELWKKNLVQSTLYGAILEKNPERNPIPGIYQDLIRVMEGKLPVATKWPTSGFSANHITDNAWRINLCQGIEIILMGETTIRNWLKTHPALRSKPRVRLDMCDQLNSAMHKLVRSYTLRYCEECRNMLVPA